VLYQMQRIQRSRVLLDAMAKNQVAVAGAYYDLDSGKVGIRHAAVRGPWPRALRPWAGGLQGGCLPGQLCMHAGAGGATACAGGLQASRTAR
jgi:hypothetical protein